MRWVCWDLGFAGRRWVFWSCLAISFCYYFLISVVLSSWSSFISSQQFHLCIQTKLQSETPLLRLTEDWRSRDSKETVTIVSKDLSKAFNSIPHALLLARLKANDLSEMSIELLRSYLSATIPHLKHVFWMGTGEKRSPPGKCPLSHIFQCSHQWFILPY